MQSQSTPGSLLDPLVPPALDEFETPTQFCRQSLTNNTISALLTAPQSLLGRQFVHHGKLFFLIRTDNVHKGQSFIPF